MFGPHQPRPSSVVVHTPISAMGQAISAQLRDARSAIRLPQKELDLLLTSSERLFTFVDLQINV